ncbi:MAG: thermonuclease family protein [Vulcanimicrobiota bacterium]
MNRKLLLNAIIVLLLAPAWARPPVSATLSGTTPEGQLVLSQSDQTDLVVDLAGIDVPPSARARFSAYCKRVLADRPITVEVVKTSAGGCTAVVKVTVPSGKKMNLNKQLLVDGYAVLDQSKFSSRLSAYQAKGKERRVGLWSQDQAHWVVPRLTGEQAMR